MVVRMPDLEVAIKWFFHQEVIASYRAWKCLHTVISDAMEISDVPGYKLTVYISDFTFF